MMMIAINTIQLPLNSTQLSLISISFVEKLSNKHKLVANKAPSNLRWRISSDFDVEAFE